MKQPDCACVHPDAHECLRIRYNIPRGKMPECLEPCECACHAKDEDGLDEWDDDPIPTAQGA